MKKIGFLLIFILIFSVFAYAKKEVKTQNAVAISGAVVIKDDGKKVTYLNKCDNCGKTGTKHTTIIYPGGKHKTSFKCNKCKNKNKTEIIRTK